MPHAKSLFQMLKRLTVQHSKTCGTSGHYCGTGNSKFIDEKAKNPTHVICFLHIVGALSLYRCQQF